MCLVWFELSWVELGFIIMRRSSGALFFFFFFFFFWWIYVWVCWVWWGLAGGWRLEIKMCLIPRYIPLSPSFFIP